MGEAARRRVLLPHDIHTEAVKLAKFKASIHRYACQIWSSDQTAKLPPHFLREQRAKMRWYVVLRIICIRSAWQLDSALDSKRISGCLEIPET
jgi:hypothetical protein